MRSGPIALALAGLMSAAEAADDRFRLAPYKDELFAYPHILTELHGGDFVIVEFVDSRDVGGRDEVRLKKAFPKFVSLDVNETKKDLVLREAGRTVRFMGVGRTEGEASIVVIFLHGGSGDRTLPMEDLRFGGNFNRLKNLVVRNKGVYLTPDLTDFSKVGTNGVAMLLEHYSRSSPDAPIIVGCASTGCKVVFRLLADSAAASRLDGVVLLGSLPLGSLHEGTILDADAFTDPANQVPIYIGHGSADVTVSWVTQELFFKRVKAASPNYPIRFELFKGEDAVHGTPLRMVDWRSVLNWMLEENEKGPRH